MHSSQHALVTTRTCHNTHSSHALNVNETSTRHTPSSHARALVTRTISTRPRHTHNQSNALVTCTISTDCQSDTRLSKHALVTLNTRTRLTNWLSTRHALVKTRGPFIHSHVWHDSFICVTWLIHMCDMTQVPLVLFFWTRRAHECMRWLQVVGSLKL